MTADDHDVRPRGGRARAALIGALLGFILGVVLFVVLDGNPFNSTNEVTYRDVVVGSVSESEDSLCWSDNPSDRDESRTCAVLALDPQVRVPQAGQAVTIGVVDIAPPNQESQRQVVYAAPAAAGDGEAGDTATASPGTGSPTEATTGPDDSSS